MGQRFGRLFLLLGLLTCASSHANIFGRLKAVQKSVHSPAEALELYKQHRCAESIVQIGHDLPWIHLENPQQSLPAKAAELLPKQSETSPEEWQSYALYGREPINEVLSLWVNDIEKRLESPVTVHAREEVEVTAKKIRFLVSLNIAGFALIGTAFISGPLILALPGAGLVLSGQLPLGMSLKRSITRVRQEISESDPWQNPAREFSHGIFHSAIPGKEPQLFRSRALHDDPDRPYGQLILYWDTDGEAVLVLSKRY